MNVFESLRTAVTGLTTNKMRAILTMLGIIIGVGSVVTLMSVGEGVEATITGEIEAQGANLLFVTADRPEDSTAPAYVTTADAEALADPFNVPALAVVVPQMQGQLRVAHGDLDENLTVSATTSQYAGLRNMEVLLGGFLTGADLDNEAKVAVLGWGAYRDLFEEGEFPVGQTITINNVRFEVVGVMEEQGGFAGDDDTVYVPLTTAQARFFPQRTLSGERPVAAIYASVVDETQVDAAIEQIERTLRERHKLGPDDVDDFQIMSQQAILDLVSEITGILTIFLGAIAGISLLVGGIGIMNIMLASVTERTREIGIRRAIGARRKQIILQFLIETVVLSTVGGITGLSLGLLIPILITLFAGMPTVITTFSIVLPLFISIGIGIVFGLYPAARASEVDPIIALRHE